MDIEAEENYTHDQYLKSKMDANVPFMDFRDEFSRRWDLPLVTVQREYEQMRRERQRLPDAVASERSRRDNESTMTTLERNILTKAIPFESSIRGFMESEDVKSAGQRLQAGTASDQDYATLARQQVQQDIDKNESTGAAIGKAAFHIPALVGEMGVGGKIVGAIGKGLGFGGKAGQVATAAKPFWQAPVSGTAKHIGQAAALTPFIPSMYLEQSSQRSAQNGGEWSDFKNLAPAVGMGIAQTAVLGTLQKGFSGMKTGGWLGRVGAKTGVAIPEQIAADTINGLIVDGVLGQKGGYGLSGINLGSGEGGEFWKAKTDDEKRLANKQAITTLATFGMFSAMHGKYVPGKTKFLDGAFDDLVKENIAKGMSPQAAQEAARQKTAEVITKTVKDAPWHKARLQEIDAEIAYLDPKNPNLRRLQTQEELDANRKRTMELRKEGLFLRDIIKNEGVLSIGTPSEQKVADAAQKVHEVAESPKTDPEVLLANIYKSKERNEYLEQIRLLGESVENGTELHDVAMGDKYTITKYTTKNGTEVIEFDAYSDASTDMFSFQRKPGEEWKTLGDPVLPRQADVKLVRPKTPWTLDQAAEFRRRPNPSYAQKKIVDATSAKTTAAVDLSKMSQADFAEHLKANRLGEKDVYELLTRRPELRDMPVGELVKIMADPAKVAAFRNYNTSHQDNMSDYTNGRKSIDGVKATTSGSGWHHFQVGDYKSSGTGTDKGYVTVKDAANTLTPEVLDGLLSHLSKSGYVGQVKIPETGARAEFSFDNVVLHGQNSQHVQNGLKSAKEYLAKIGVEVTGTQTGRDSGGKSHTDLLADSVKNARVSPPANPVPAETTPVAPATSAEQPKTRQPWVGKPKKSDEELDSTVDAEEQRFAEQRLAPEATSRQQFPVGKDKLEEARMKKIAEMEAGLAELRAKQALIPGEPVTKADRDLVKKIQKMEQDLAEAEDAALAPIPGGETYADYILGKDRQGTIDLNPKGALSDEVGGRSRQEVRDLIMQRFALDRDTPEGKRAYAKLNKLLKLDFIPGKRSTSLEELSETMVNSGDMVVPSGKSPILHLLDLIVNDKPMEGSGAEYRNRELQAERENRAGLRENEWAEKEQRAEGELDASLEEVRGMYSSGPLPPIPKGTGTGKNIPTPPEIVATMEATPGIGLFQVGGKPSALNQNAVAVALRQGKQGAIAVDGWWRTEPRVVMEEIAHVLGERYKIDFDPAKLPQDVRDGLVEFDQNRNGNGKLGMQEGFGQWAVRRMANELGTTGQGALTANQQAAARWAESQVSKWKELKILDKARELYMKWDAGSNLEKAGGLLGMQPAKPQLSFLDKLKGKVRDWADKFANTHLNNQHSLEMMKRRQKEKGLPTDGIEKVIHAATRETAGAASALALKMKNEGFPTIDANGVMKPISGETLVKAVKDSGISEDRLIPMDKKAEGPMKQLARAMFGTKNESGLLIDNYERASEADVFMVGRQLIDRADNHGEMSVRPDQLQLMRDVMADFQKAPDYANLVAFHDKITNLFNESQLALAAPAVHRLSMPDVQRQIKDNPTYVELSRIQQDESTGSFYGGRKMSGERSRKGISGDVIQPPLMSLDRRFTTTAEAMTKQLKDNALADFLTTDQAGEFAGIPEPIKQTPQGAAKLAEIQRLRNSNNPLDKRMADELERQGIFSDYIYEPWKEGKDNTYIVYGQDGKPMAIPIKNKMLYEYLTDRAVDADFMAAFLKQASAYQLPKMANKIVKVSATGTRASFQLFQIITDSLEFIANTINRGSVFKLPKAYYEMAATEWAELTGKPIKDELRKMFVEGGANQLRKFNFDAKKPGSIYDQLTGKMSVLTAKDKAFDFGRKFFNLLGSTELGPRFLEFQNYLKQVREPNGQLRYDMKAVREGRQDVKHEDFVGAMYSAGEVTTPFYRGGVLTKQLNKMTPYYGPAVAGLTKVIRNARDNPKGAAIAIGIAATLRLLHWAMFKDEDWFKELSAEDRKGFVFPVGNGKFFKLPGFRDVNALTGGVLLSTLDQQRGQDPRWKDTIDTSIKSMLPPGIGEGVADIAKGDYVPGAVNIALTPTGPIGNTFGDIVMNRNWAGSKIVPNRDKDMSSEQKIEEYYLPYAFKQMTAGRLGGGPETAQFWKAAGLDFYRESRPNKSVNDVYQRVEELREIKARENDRGRTLTPSQENEFTRLSRAAEAISKLYDKARGETRSKGVLLSKKKVSDEEKRAIAAQQLKIARAALGRR